MLENVSGFLGFTHVLLTCCDVLSSVACPGVVDEGNCHHTWRVAANMPYVECAVADS
jgi:hypothetical protein